MKRFRSILVFFVLAVSGGLLSGCGGQGVSGPGGNVGPAGDARITFVWPQRSRLIPLAANSVKITLSNANHTYNKTVNRTEAVNSQAANILFTGVVVGDYTVTATAYPNANATGNAQATGQTNVTITQGQTSQFTCTMGSTVTSVEIGGQLTVNQGAKQTYFATAYDAGHIVVLVASSTWAWTAGANATVNGQPTATGGSVKFKSTVIGSSSISVQYTEPTGGGPSKTETVDVVAPSTNPGGAIGRGGGFPGPGGFDDWAAGNDVAGFGSQDQVVAANFGPASGSGLSLAGPLQAPIWTSEIGDPGSFVYVATGVAGDGRTYSATDQSVYAGDWGQVVTKLFDVIPTVDADNTVIDIAVDLQHRIYVLAKISGNYVVRRYAESGSFNTLHSTATQLNHIAADSDGVVFVQANNSNIFSIDILGTLHDPFVTGFFAVDDIGAGGDGNLYVLESGFVSVWDEGGNFIEGFDASSFIFTTSNDRVRMAIDPSNQNVYILKSYKDSNFFDFFEVKAYIRS